jgi:hypothetical protein
MGHHCFILLFINSTGLRLTFVILHGSYFLSDFVLEFVFLDGSDIVSELVFTILSFIAPIRPDTELVVAVGVESVATFSLFSS